jgi:hypothetical protein
MHFLRTLITNTLLRREILINDEWFLIETEHLYDGNNFGLGEAFVEYFLCTDCLNERLKKVKERLIKIDWRSEGF